jgi:hypothetical protein
MAEITNNLILFGCGLIIMLALFAFLAGIADWLHSRKHK